MNAFPHHLNNLTARIARESDQEFMQQLYAATRDDLRMIPGDPAFVTQLIAMQQQMQTAGYRNIYPNAEYWVIEHAGKPIGRIVLHITPAEIRVVDMAVLPEVRSKGFGTEVLRAIQKNATERKLSLALRVHHDNPRAQRLYAALGFVTTSSDDLSEQMQWRAALEDDRAPCPSS